MRMRTLGVSGLLSLFLVVSSACEKGGGSTNPEPADALSEVDDGKTRLKYLESGFELESKITEEFSVSGGAAGKRFLTASGTIVAMPTSDGKLLVKLTNNQDVELREEGAMVPEVDEGEEPIDNLAKLKGAKSWYVMDRIGDMDSDASEALPENVERKKARDAAKDASDDSDMALRSLEVGASMQLPPLPTTGLVLGEEVKVPTREEVQDTAGGDMDVEIDAAYLLKALDEVGGHQHATVEIEIISSGAAELNFGQGAMFVAFDAEVLGTLVFDLDAGIPVSWEGDSLSEIHFGEKTFEQNQTTASTFTVAGAVPEASEATPAPEAVEAEPEAGAAQPAQGEAAPADKSAE